MVLRISDSGRASGAASAGAARRARRAHDAPRTPGARRRVMRLEVRRDEPPARAGSLRALEIDAPLAGDLSHVGRREHSPAVVAARSAVAPVPR